VEPRRHDRQRLDGPLEKEAAGRPGGGEHGQSVAGVFPEAAVGLEHPEGMQEPFDRGAGV
jgi:hypothetical protein